MESETIQRPNGKPYRPRRVIAYGVGEDGEGVLVLGTQDLARAQVLAEEHGRAGVLFREIVETGYRA